MHAQTSCCWVKSHKNCSFYWNFLSRSPKEQRTSIFGSQKVRTMLMQNEYELFNHYNLSCYIVHPLSFLTDMAKWWGVILGHAIWRPLLLETSYWANVLPTCVWWFQPKINDIDGMTQDWWLMHQCSPICLLYLAINLNLLIVLFSIISKGFAPCSGYIKPLYTAMHLLNFSTINQGVHMKGSVEWWHVFEPYTMISQFLTFYSRKS